MLSKAFFKRKADKLYLRSTWMCGVVEGAVMKRKADMLSLLLTWMCGG